MRVDIRDLVAGTERVKMLHLINVEHCRSAGSFLCALVLAQSGGILALAG